ncbi:uncharacterized protein LOC127766269 [Oryza glaberrima]|uniref:uncharacterized protein LOC127766269 n=1 Tax=Oryza glaberrima TaxID=4538 RepID=UPI00224C3423|nr:uncharacterized protein LOC127766269 [Oryza glaberrima]
MGVEDRSWMYSGWNDNGCHSEEWVRNTNAFVDRAFGRVQNAEKFGVECPCSICRNRIRRKKEVMSMHLCQRGFMPDYTRWIKHGEHPVRLFEPEETYNIADPLGDMLGNFGDAMDTDFSEDEPTADAKAFYAMLAASQEQLYSFTQVSRLTAVTRLMGIKSQHNISSECMNNLLSLIGDIMPSGHKMPANLYECKNLLSGLKMPYVKIDVCINNCMIYYKEDALKEKCDICNENRYVAIEEEHKGRKRKPVPRKVMRYLPFIPRLQRMYMEPGTAKHMRFHKDGTRANPNTMVHPSDGEAWKYFDRHNPNFALDARNVRLAVATDGFNPFGFGAQYSCWPVFIIPLNLPPTLCMKDENIFLSLVIPGPNHPGKNLNVFMRPLVDEFKQAWQGVVTYDSSVKQNFNMRAAYHTSIHDGPALAMFSGWSTHGGLSCQECMADIHTTWLHNGHKYSWFDCHRRFLPPNHPFRGQRNAFSKDTVMHDLPPRRLTGEEVEAYIKNTFDNSFEGYGTTHNWTHMPIWWELPYFSTILVRHNIDVMHNEKNVAEAIWSTCLDISDKTKDNVKARLDQELMCSRVHLNLVEKPNGKWEKPRAPYCLTRAQKKEIMQWFMGIKFPDGFIKKLKQKVRNKARVEGSIVEAYLVEEISHFTSLFLPDLIASSRNRPHRYAQVGPTSESNLSLFQVQGWKTGRGISRTLTFEEQKKAMIYIYTNMSEMDGFVEKFEQEQWMCSRPPNQKELDKLIWNGVGNGKPNLLDWFKKLCSKDASIHNDLRRLSRGFGLKVKSYVIYEVNGYKFRSEKYEKSKGNLTTVNTGVLAVGIDDNTGKELEYYGIIMDIIELKFDGDENFKLVLFDCHWFHPVNGVRHLEKFGLVEVAHASCNPADEPFVLASQVSQVYYVPYACTTGPNLNAWWVAYKVRPLGSLPITSLDDYNSSDPSCVDIFQEDGLEGEFIIDIGQGLDNIVITDVDEITDQQDLSTINNRSTDMSEDNDLVSEDEESEDDNESIPEMNDYYYRQEEADGF